MAQDRIRITSPAGSVVAELNDTPAGKALQEMLPMDLPMQDHLRQEKTGTLPRSLPTSTHQRDFSAGILGLWDLEDFVIYYSNGQVPPPGIVVLGRVLDDVSIFDTADPMSVRIEAVN